MTFFGPFGRGVFRRLGIATAFEMSRNSLPNQIDRIGILLFRGRRVRYGVLAFLLMPSHIFPSPPSSGPKGAADALR